MTDEKKIWPNWQKTGKPNKEDGTVWYFDEDGEDGVDWCNWNDIIESTELNRQWASHPYKKETAIEYINENMVATPQECEDKKKDFIDECQKDLKRPEIVIIDDYQKIYPDWINHRLPTKKEDMEKPSHFLIYRNDEITWGYKTSIKKGETWCVEPDTRHLPGRFNEHIATPLECFCKKHSIHTNLKDFAKDVVKKVEAGGGSIGFSTVKTEGDGGFLVPGSDWIPGNEPEKEGTYEITSEYHGVHVIFFSGTEWYSRKDYGGKIWYMPDVIAYKPITLSDAYVKPDTKPIKKELKVSMKEDDVITDILKRIKKIEDWLH
jgi:hypothetical protein